MSDFGDGVGFIVVDVAAGGGAAVGGVAVAFAIFLCSRHFVCWPLLTGFMREVYVLCLGFAKLVWIR